MNKKLLDKVQTVSLRKLGCSALLLLTTSAQAGWQGNALVGISGAYARYDGHYDIGLLYTGFPVLPKTDFQDRQRNSGFGGGALAGYQMRCNDWLLGLELSADWYDTNKERIFTFNDDFSVLAWNTRLLSRNKGFYAASARAGYFMAPFFMSYVRFGIETAHEELLAQFQGAPTLYPFGLTLKDHVWQNHLYVGVGAEFPVFCHLSIRMEYNYHFPSHSTRGRGMIVDGVVNPAFSIEARPSIDTGKLSLVWNF